MKNITESKTNESKTLTVSIPYQDDSVWDKSDKVDKIAEKFKGKRNGSGAGFGYRDIDYTFKNAKQTEEFIEGLKKLNIEGLKTYYWSESIKY